MTIQSLQFQTAIRFFDINANVSGKTPKGIPDISPETTADYTSRLQAFRIEVLIQTNDNVQQQSGVADRRQSLPPIVSELQYNGHPLTDLTPVEARELVSDDGFFGVAKTAARIADFVLKGAGDNLDTLKAGREGILNGFKEAEKLWGGKLPDISYDTLEKSLGSVDDRIKELEGSIVDVAV